MRFVIVGYGRVGARTARILHEEGHEVVVVENDAEKAERARERGLEVVHGDGSDPTVLEEARLDGATAVGGLTGDPAVNYEVCVVGKQRGARTVMRLSEDVPAGTYEEYEAAADEIIYPERLGAAGAKTALLGGDFNAIGELTERLRLTVVRVPADAPVVGEQVAHLDRPDALVYAHGRKREPMDLPLPGTVVEAGDRLAIIVEREAVPAVREAFLGG
jgi:trk system potassium uptake protein TrkA